MNRPLKLLITGAYATGKSTLVSALDKVFTESGLSHVVVADVARTCKFPLNQEQTFQTSAWLIGQQICAETMAVFEEPKLVICDRGIPDILSHSQLVAAKLENDKKWFNAVRDLSAAWAWTYDLVFWATVDVDREIEADGLRIVDKEYQKSLERQLKIALSTLAMNRLVLPLSLNDRVDLIVSTVSTKLLNA